MIPQIQHEEVHNWFNYVLATDLCPFLIGDVGKGKSQLAISYAKNKQLQVHTIYLDSMYEMDVIGYATPNKEKGKFEYLPCDLFPLAGEKLGINPDTNKPYKGHLIIFEEFGNCPKSMQVAAQRILLEKSIGSHKLHEKAKIVLLGNKVSSGANAVPISSAIRSRCGIAELETKSVESISKFQNFIQSQNWHPSVVAWVQNNPDEIKEADPKLVHDGESPFTTWRCLEAVSTMMKRLQDSAGKRNVPMTNLVRNNLVTFQSIMGYTNGSDFHASLMNPSVGLEEILTNPESAQVPSSTADILKVSQYLVSNVTTEDTVDTMLTYLERLDPEARMSVASKITASSNFLQSHKKVKAIFQFPF